MGIGVPDGQSEGIIPAQAEASNDVGLALVAGLARAIEGTVKPIQGGCQPFCVTSLGVRKAAFFIEAGEHFGRISGFFLADFVGALGTPEARIDGTG